MKILHKYVLKEHFGPLVFAMTALTSLLLLQYIAKRFGELVGKGLPWSVIGEFLVLSLPLTIALSLPMTVLVATLYAFSRLAAENEITAMKASGVSLRSLLAPVLFAAAGVTLFMVGFNDQILPRANHRLRTLQGDIAQKKPTFALREQVINEVSPGKLYLRAGRISQTSNKMRDVTIYDVGDYTRRRTIYADSGNMAVSPDQADLLLTLYSGTVQDVPIQKPQELQRLYFDTQLIRVKGVGNEFQKTQNDTYKGEREMSVCEMYRNAASAKMIVDVARQEFNEKVKLAKQRKVKLSKEVLATRTQPPFDIPVGKYYCKLLQQTGVKALAAQTPVQTPVQQPQQRDSIKARTDSIRASIEAESKRMDSVQTVAPAAPPAAPAVTLPATTIPPAIAPRGPVPVARPGTSVVVDSSKQQILSARAAAAPSQGVTNAAGEPIPNEVIPAQVEAARLRVIDQMRSLNRYEVEIHKKFALAAACFIFVLLGAPIALRFPRAGVGLTIGVSLVVFGLYYVGLIAGESLARRGIVPPIVSMWIANVVFLLIALILLMRMGKEAGSSRGGDLREVIDNFKYRFRRKPVPSVAPRSVPRTSIT
ncbi:MAG TPA: LptF/LptG family permease [Gemmatimonadaceae bacterium]